MSTTTPAQGFDPTARAMDVFSRVYDLSLLQKLVYRQSQDVVIAALRLARPRRIADVGCGTGVLTTRMAAELDADEVYGFDISSGMLQKARARSADVLWREGPAERLPLADGSIDAVISTEAFHFFDRPAALREFHRVLAPGGTLIVASFNAPLDQVGALMSTSLVSVSSPAGVRRLVTDAGFDVVEQRRVGRALTALFPTVATIATRPERSPA